MYDTPKRRGGGGGGGNSGYVRVNRTVRILVMIFAWASFAWWGYITWPFPLPSVYFLVGLPVFASIVWKLFRARKALLPTDDFGKMVVEFAIMGAATFTWFDMGHWVVGTAFGVIAAISGTINFRRESQ